MVQVQRLAALGWDAVHVQADQLRVVRQARAGFFVDFAPRGIVDCGVRGFHVASRQQPAFQPPVMDDENALSVRRQHEAGTGDVAGRELFAGERRGRMPQQHQDQVLALEGFAIAVETGDLLHESRDGVYHAEATRRRGWR